MKKRKKKNQNNSNRNLYIGIAVIILLFIFAFYYGDYNQVNEEGLANSGFAYGFLELFGPEENEDPFAGPRTPGTCDLSNNRDDPILGDGTNSDCDGLFMGKYCDPETLTCTDYYETTIYRLDPDSPNLGVLFTCTDTDTANDIHLKGELIIDYINDPNDGDPIFDRCESAKVIQYKCSNSPPSHYFILEHTCKTGCRDGACISGFGE